MGGERRLDGDRHGRCTLATLRPESSVRGKNGAKENRNTGAVLSLGIKPKRNCHNPTRGPSNAVLK